MTFTIKVEMDEERTSNNMEVSTSDNQQQHHNPNPTMMNENEEQQPPPPPQDYTESNSGRNPEREEEPQQQPNNQNDDYNQPPAALPEEQSMPASQHHNNNEDGGVNNNTNTNRTRGYHQRPDFGTDFIPNAGPTKYAPKALDHFQRGQEERSIHRDRNQHDYYHRNIDGHFNSNSNSNNTTATTRPGRGGGGGGYHTNNNYQGRGGGSHNHTNNHHNPGGRGNHYDRGDRNSNNNNNNNYAGDRARYSGSNNNSDDPWNHQHRDRPTILQGLDINALVDRLTTKLNNKTALFADLDRTRIDNRSIFDSGKALTALISIAARRKNIGLGHAAWDWMDHAGIAKNTFHYNSMISVTEKARDYQHALALLQEMKERNIKKNEVTFSSAISACEKCGMWQKAMHLLDTMVDEGVPRSAIAFNATISACEKGMVPQKACEVFYRMKREGITPSVVSYSALISAAEKGGQWRLALEILEEMKAEGFRGNVVAYSAAISALAKGQQWRKALQLFREIQSQRGTPSIVTYNATMTALEKGMEWERALDLFEEMKMHNLPITVVSYGSAISACDKGFQFRQCLEFLDEMTEMGIPKNVIIFGAAMSCMEKCSRADIGFQLMKRMKEEGIAPNVHIYNSAISACARSNLWEKGYELYEEMEREDVKRDVVTFNAVLDAVCSQIQLGRRLFEVGVERGFYAKVSRLGEQWFELDLHFLSLGGGEIALGWWFEVCLVPYLVDTDKLNSVKSISIVTGYGKTRTRGRRNGDDGMRKRCRAMLRFMGIGEQEQPNLGRIHIDKESLIELVNKNGGRIIFDLDGYLMWKEEETITNALPDVEQKIRARFKPTMAGSGGPPFTRVESEFTYDEYRLENLEARLAKLQDQDMQDNDEKIGDAEYVRENQTFQRGLDETVSRDRAGRGVSGEMIARDASGIGGPRSQGRRVEHDGSNRWVDDSLPSYGDSRGFDRGRPFDDNKSIPDHRNSSQLRYISENNREADSAFLRNAQSDSRFNDQRLNSVGHQSNGEGLGSKGDTTRRFDQNQDYEQQRLGGRQGQHDHVRDTIDHMYPKQAHFTEDRNVGVSQSVHPVGSGPYEERSMLQRDFRADERGTGHQQYPDSGHVAGRHSDRNFPSHGNEFQSSPFDRGFQGPRESWRHGEHTVNGHGQNEETDHTALRSSIDDRAYNERSSYMYERRVDHGRSDESVRRDGSHPHSQGFSSSLGSHDNKFEIDDPQYQDQNSRIVGQDMLRKRQHNEATSQQQQWHSDSHPPQADRMGISRPMANNSRGYTLEPETQRRRLS